MNDTTGTTAAEPDGTSTFASDDGDDWDPDDLPEVPAAASGREISVGGIVWGVVAATLIPVALVLQHVRSPFVIDGERLPLFHPDLWSTWFPALFVIVVVMIAIELWKLRTRRWTLALVVANVVTNLVFLAYFAALFSTQDVWNPDYVVGLEDQTGFVLDGSVVEPAVVAGVTLVCVWDSVQCVITHLRSRAA